MRLTQWRHGLFIGVLLLVAFWLLSSIFGLAEKAKIAASQAHEAQGELRQLDERKAALEKSLAALSTARGKDAAIRTAFGVARPGEEVIVVVPPSPPATTSEPSWWDKLWSWL